MNFLIGYTAIISIFQLLANRIRIENAPRIELNLNRIKTKIEFEFELE
jgi:hypothetical protein